MPDRVQGNQYAVKSFAADDDRFYFLASPQALGAAPSLLITTDHEGGEVRAASFSSDPIMRVTADSAGGIVLHGIERDENSKEQREVLAFSDKHSLLEQRSERVPSLTAIAAHGGNVVGVGLDGEVLDIGSKPIKRLFAVVTESDGPWRLVWLSGDRLAAVSGLSGAILLYDWHRKKVTRAHLAGDEIGRASEMCADARSRNPRMGGCVMVPAAVGDGGNRMFLFIAPYRDTEGFPVIEVDPVGAIASSYRLLPPPNSDDGKKFSPSFFGFAAGKLIVADTSGRTFSYSIHARWGPQ